ncbi:MULTISPECIES: glucuronate isomerase [unclassified Gilliamella]|uniref:glucuronate isomerase n=1 Tax=unclassified Gilliamella TaxID=2685620 RepID=UPI00132C3EAC|nr:MULTISPECIES: glucuronate isomerase [unclassified Gilliamella]MWN32543.1 glucuronate isomerase [Gilliamella sp. Pra-s60]MWP29991.1 glucuronate isomerase [Gilliamella sp. Pra-s54]
MSFIHENFLLNNRIAQKLYHEFAKSLPIIDYHCHLDPKEIAENKKFDSIYDLWLAGDHYKWRAMRANGVDEAFITGSASPLEKFKVWSETVENTIGNPLYHWSHLELANYFGIKDTLNKKNYYEIWNQCNHILKEQNYTTQRLISLSNVEIICTTDSPLDSLQYHDEIKQQHHFKTQVLPTFRPDEALDADGEKFILFVQTLEQSALIKINNFHDYLAALENRVEYFHQKGCRLSDHGLMNIEFYPSDLATQNILFEKKMNNIVLNKIEEIQYKSAVLIALAGFYYKRNWTMQIHFGVIRNNNKVMLNKVGINSGFDSICDQQNLAINLNQLLNKMNELDSLPNTIIYNLDPSVNDIVASTIANFQKSGLVKSNMQFGAGWWFSDTKRGMLRQLTTLADHGLLINFVGMLTDSRSFVSYTRHEYFRRILCNLIGKWVTDGEIPHDDKLLEKLITGICYKNALSYFRF